MRIVGALIVLAGFAGVVLWIVIARRIQNAMGLS